MSRRKATQQWQQKLASKDTPEYEELNDEVYKNISSSPHFEDSIGWHVAWQERRMKTRTARAWVRRLLWRYGTDLGGATRDTLYREAYRLYQEAVKDAEYKIFDNLMELLGEQPRVPYLWMVKDGKVSQEEYDQARAELDVWYAKLYALRNAARLSDDYVDIPTDYEVTFKLKDKEATTE
jgi:hypothetical protein